MSDTVAQNEPVRPIRDASTVMLVRDGESGPEVFLQRRTNAMAFAAGMTVFPGGGVDPSDARAEIAWAGPGPDWWAQRFDVTPARAQALVCAAVRETFEECGVLLAGPTAETVVADSTTYRAAREQLERRELSLGDFLAREELVLRADLLRPWANWTTPTIEPRRYDTYFFVAVLPEGQLADGATSEAHDVAWRTPAQAVRRWLDRLDVLLPPTWTQLTSIGRYSTTAEILAANPVIETVEPDAEIVDGALHMVFPDSERYFADLPPGMRLLGSQRPE